jgi:hypothetical protein
VTFAILQIIYNEVKNMVKVKKGSELAYSLMVLLTGLADG